MEHYFTTEKHIVRKIWGNSDTVLLIFAGSAAEFALNKAVDWLYFTGRIPSDPIGRLFSTVSYARRIIFSTEEKAFAVIDQMNTIHTGVENSRGFRIPPWAFRDVLYMLVHYSIAAFELLERKLTNSEKEEVYATFHKLGQRMNIPELPGNYADWVKVIRCTFKLTWKTHNIQEISFCNIKSTWGPFGIMFFWRSRK